MKQVDASEYAPVTVLHEIENVTTAAYEE